MKIGLQAGVCSGRWHCKNLNTSNCHTIPQENKNYVDCDYYEKSDK